MASPNVQEWERGSSWRRWNPHIHAPGTLFNDQFKGDWVGYLDAIEKANPVVEALGVTDYFSIECYKKVKACKGSGRLTNVTLIFPNVEMRMDLETEKKRAINLHLLFSPDDPDHEDHIERVLADLTFEYKRRKFRCVVDDLRQLGRAHKPDINSDQLALSEGANQFKVSLDQLKKMFRDDEWISRNCIVGVAASNNDGSAALQNDSSFTLLRKELERFAQVVFAATPGTRDFWLGKTKDYNISKLNKEYCGRKPCLHGCDAHNISNVCNPDLGRYCWIKGDPTFESLRQVLLEPEERVWIGNSAPDRHDASMCISRTVMSGTSWIVNHEVKLNPGLVAIIGSRGSGKTALADIISLGANVESPFSLDSSFLSRASRPIDHLENAEIHLFWGDGANAKRGLCPANNWVEAINDGEGVRYLSQQFVEQLCSAEGLAIELRNEIERVIFEATPQTDRLDADSFNQLSHIHLDPIYRQRQVAQETIESTSSQVNAEDALHGKLSSIKKERDDKQKRIEKLKEEMKTLMPKGMELRAKRLSELEAAVVSVTSSIDKQRLQIVRLGDLQKEIERIRKTIAPQLLSKIMSDFQDTGLTQLQWHEFGLIYRGNPDVIISERKSVISSLIKHLAEGNPTTPIDISTAPLTSCPLNALVLERDRVKAEVGIDAGKQKRYEELRRTLEVDERFLQRLNKDLDNANGAAVRRKALVERRRELYVEVFQTYLEEQKLLQELYGPLQNALVNATGTLNRLRFAVSREIDLNAWVERGEQLLDLRIESKLRGRGALRKEAEKSLLKTWKNGSAEEVGTAIQSFIQDNYDDIKKSVPPSVSDTQIPEWMQQVASWLYSTEHIQIRYCVTYDGVAIEQLSPGTRGIVLLLLYLVIDKHDLRPLIIDQPEENLDPKSVFEELVPHFREARKRRQVIIVTHNANLVVNTDADQVIVATAQPNPAGGLPTVTYQCGSIENKDIRTAVCEILEGGEAAFLDRERRYRLHWERNL